MRSAPRKFDVKKMPSIMDAAKMIQKIVDRPQNRLGDASVGSLVELFSDGTPAWLTGSTVWLPAVFGDNPVQDGDFDIVFSSKESCARFVAGAVGELNRRIPTDHKKFEAGTNALGGSRILHPDGKGVIDAWFLGENESIAELVMAYPGGSHYKCAYYISRSPNPGCLFRLVNVSEEKASLDDTAYPGRRTTAKKKKGLLDGLLSMDRKIGRSSYPYDID